jgi:hypothetical protein
MRFIGVRGSTVSEGSVSELTNQPETSSQPETAQPETSSQPETPDSWYGAHTRATPSETSSQPETAQPETSSQPETPVYELFGTIPSRVWPTIIAVLCLAWILMLGGIVWGTVTVTSELGYVFVAIWMGFPVALSIDAWALREMEWPQYWWIYVYASLLSIILFLPIIPAFVYLYRRQTHLS